jgi:hypothetical protein
MADYTSIVLDYNNQPHIVYTYLDWDKEELRYAKKINSKWTIFTIESKDFQGISIRYSSISCDTNNKPHVSYSKNDRVIKYASYDSIPPTIPTITGPKTGRVGVSYDYSFVSIVPDGGDVFYWIDWGDGSNSEWVGPYHSGETVSVAHTWTEKNICSIRVKAKNTYETESDWSDSLEVTMPRNKEKNILLINYLENYPVIYHWLKRLSIF